MVGVADDDVRLETPSVLRAHGANAWHRGAMSRRVLPGAPAAGLLLFAGEACAFDLRHAAIHLDPSPNALEKRHHGPDEHPRASHHIMDSPGLLQMVDHRVDRGDPQWVAPNEERVEAENLAQVRVTDVGADHTEY